MISNLYMKILFAFIIIYAVNFFTACTTFEEKWDRGAVFDMNVEECTRMLVFKVPFYIWIASKY